MNLSEIPLIEQHAHNILKSEIAANYPFAAAFTEGYDPEIINYHAKNTLFYRRSLREIATLLNCEPEETAILANRQNLGLENLTRIYFDAANLEAIYLDDGLTPENILPISWHQQFTKVKRILRLELLAEKLLSQIDEFHAFVNAFIKAIDPPSPVKRKGGIALSTAVTSIKPLVEEKGRFEQIDIFELERQKRIILNFIMAIQDKYGKAWERKDNVFLYASGFAGAMEFLHLKMIPYCSSKSSFTIETIKETLDFNSDNLISQSEVTGMAGTTAQKYVYEKLVKIFKPINEPTKQIQI